MKETESTVGRAGLLIPEPQGAQLKFILHLKKRFNEVVQSPLSRTLWSVL